LSVRVGYLKEGITVFGGEMNGIGLLGGFVDGKLRLVTMEGYVIPPSDFAEVVAGVNAYYASLSKDDILGLERIADGCKALLNVGPPDYILPIPSKKRVAMYERFKGKCYYCGSDLDINTFHADHVFPKSRGGSRTGDNLVAACPPCNMKKHARTPEEAGMVRIMTK
jgi:hypothetical protein